MANWFYLTSQIAAGIALAQVAGKMLKVIGIG